MSVDMATLALVVDGDKATQQVKAFSAEAEKAAGVTAVLTEEAEGLEAGFAKVRTVLGLGLFGFEFTKSAINAQNSMAQLEAGLKSTGGAAGFTSNQLRDQAYAMEEVSTFTHTAIEQTQGILLLYQKLTGVQFSRATQDAADLAQRLGVSAPQAARELGRALDEPATGMQALRRAGVTFSAGQKEVIDKLVQTGQQAQAQNLILDALESKLKGSASAARDTLGGALLGVSHAFENLFEVSKGGSSTLISALNGISHGLDDLREHSEALAIVAVAIGGYFGAKNLAIISEYGNSLLKARAATIAAAEAEVIQTRALVVSSAAEAERAQWDEKLAASTLINAKAHEQCAFTVEEEAVEMAALKAAEATMLSTQEASIAATLALTEAQVAEGAAVTALGIATSLSAGLIAKAATLAKVAWAAIGGWVGVALAAALAINAALDEYIKHEQKAVEQTDAQSAATDRALAKERQRNAAIVQAAEDAANAAADAKKANTERDAETKKLQGLNAAYMQSSGALKIREIELTANVEKSKAHKEVLQSEWAAIDRSIDSLTREQVAQVKLAAAKKSVEDIKALGVSNDADLVAATSADKLAVATANVAHAQLINADATLDAQNQLEHLKNQIDAAATAQAAWATFQRTTVGATNDEIKAAKALYDQTISGIGATLQAKNANADSNEELQRSIQLAQTAAKSKADLAAASANSAANLKTIQDNRAIAEAENDVTLARFNGGRATDEAQAKVEHLQNALNAENEITAAGVELKKASVNATDEQVRAAIALYDATVQGVDAAKKATDSNIDAAIAAQALADARDKALGLVQNFFSAAQNGARSFWNFFKQEAEQAITELIERQLINKLFSSSGSLSNILGSIGIGGGGSGGNITPANLFSLPSSTQRKIGGAVEGLGMATAGFGIGESIGGMTSNRALGALGGAVGGAATGAELGAMGGPIGVVAGGIIGAGAGLIGGFLGAGKSASEVAKALAQLKLDEASVHASLADWRAQITGTAADQAAAAKADLYYQYLSEVQTINSTEAGKKKEAQRNKDLDTASQLYEMAQKKLTGTTMALNAAFATAIGQVQGYNLNLKLFQFTPKVGPPIKTMSSAPAPGQGDPGGGGPNGSNDGSGDNGSFDVLSNRPIILQMAVDGKVLATKTVQSLRKLASSNLGDSSDIVGAMNLI